MRNYRLTIDLQMNSDTTATTFANILSKTMEITARTTIDICDSPEARVILGATKLESSETFYPNTKNKL